MKRTIVCFVSLLLVLIAIVSVHAAPSTVDQLGGGWNEESPPSGTVTIGLRPASVAKIPGTTFIMEIVIDATSQEIDSAQAHLDFDPSYLTVVDEDAQPACEIIPGTALPMVMQNVADNKLGQISYAAGHLVPGTMLQRPFVLATIRFRAEDLTPYTDVVFHLDGFRKTKINIGYTSVPIHAITDGQVRIYVYRLFMSLVEKGHHHY